MATGHRNPQQLPLRRAIGLVVIFGILTYLLTIHWQQLFTPPQFSATAAPNCDLNIEPCTALFGGTRSIRLMLEPRPLTASRPMQLRIESEDIMADTAHVAFNGVDMNMGRLAIPLRAQHNGVFTVETMLPACIRQKMTWQAVISLESAQGSYNATFVFDVNRD